MLSFHVRRMECWWKACTYKVLAGTWRALVWSRLSQCNWSVLYRPSTFDLSRPSAAARKVHMRAMRPNNVTIARITQTDQRPFPLAVYDCHCSWRVQIIYVVFFAFAIEVIFLSRFVCCFANSSVGLFTWQIVDDFLLYFYYYVIHYIRESVDYMSYTTWFMHKIT